MKFSNGQWLIREGLSVANPVEVNDFETTQNSLTVYAPGKHIDNRGATLDGPLFTVEYSSPMPDVIGVQIAHFTGKGDRGPAFEIHREETPVEIVNSPETLSLTSGYLTARIQKTTEAGKKWAVDFLADGRSITGSSFGNAGYVVTDQKEVYLKEELNLKVGECVYGLGERFTSFVKNGQVVDIWNEDGGTETEQAYKSIPFYLTNRGYGVFVNHPERVSFEVASEKVFKVQFCVPGEKLEYYVIYGPTPKEILGKYTRLTGRPALPPAWSFGLWLSTSFTTEYDEKTVNSFIEGMEKRDLPLAVFHFDCFWMKEYHWCNFEWDGRVFPDPRGMLARLKAKGLKICIWINPYIAQRSRLFEEGKAKGYLLKTQNGAVWQWDKWQAGMGIVDFTNPEACRWFTGYLEQLLDMGVDCFKTDFGERIPTDVVYFDGSDPLKMHNFYTHLYNKTVFELLKKKLGPGKVMVFARSATAGGQQFPVHWGGDCWANFESMAESLRAGLSLGLSGFGFWSHDIGGFEQTASATVYKRWVAFGLLSSHSRLHGSSSYRVPWLFDEEAVDVLRFFTKLKCSLMPYLFAKACEANRKGTPVMRAMMLEFPNDPGCDYLDRQYMLGDAFMVAPVFDDDGMVNYYLPQGQWTHYLTGEKICGGCWREEHHGYLSLPLLVRPNTLLAVGKMDNRPDYDYAEDVVLHLFELEDGRNTSTTVYNTEGAAELEVDVKRSGETISVQARGVGKPWSILLRGIQNAKIAGGGTCRATPRGALIKPENYSGALEIQVEE
jgi:alpha-D-xyloside xylohydrolase